MDENSVQIALALAELESEKCGSVASKVIAKRLTPLLTEMVTRLDRIFILGIAQVSPHSSVLHRWNANVPNSKTHASEGPDMLGISGSGPADQT